MSIREWSRKMWLASTIGFAAVVLGLGFVGFQWRSHVPLKHVEIVGTLCADADEIRRLAAIDSVAYLYDLDPTIIADRVQRHPWVGQARVSRLPTGKLRLRVRERDPVLLLVRHGGPAFYLDREGFRMPLSDRIDFDVPLLSAPLPDVHPMKPVQHAVVLELAELLGNVGPPVQALISEITVDGDGQVVVYTTAIPERQSMPVLFGDRDFEDKLDRLSAFWKQAVLRNPDVEIQQIDLRFDGQIVTS